MKEIDKTKNKQKRNMKLIYEMQLAELNANLPPFLLFARFSSPRPVGKILIPESLCIDLSNVFAA